MISFEQARQIVEDELRQTWPDDFGDLTVSPDGYVDPTHFAVFHHGAAPDPAPTPISSGLVAWVDRMTGEVDWWPQWNDFPRLDLMEPIGGPTECDVQAERSVG